MTVLDLLRRQAARLGGAPTAAALAASLSVERFGYPAIGSPAYKAVVAFRKLRHDVRLQKAQKALEATMHSNPETDPPIARPPRIPGTTMSSSPEDFRRACREAEAIKATGGGAPRTPATPPRRRGRPPKQAPQGAAAPPAAPSSDEPGRRWTPIGGDLEASYDGHRYVDVRVKGADDSRLFLSEGAVDALRALFPPDPKRIP